MRLCSEASGGRLEVIEVRQFDRALPAGDARRMRQQVANFDVFLAVCRKFGPVMSNFLVHVQLAAFDQQERTQGRHGLGDGERVDDRSEEHTSELQSLMRISYAVFCLK